MAELIAARRAAGTKSSTLGTWQLPAEGGRREQDVVSAAIFMVVAAFLLFTTMILMANPGDGTDSGGNVRAIEVKSGDQKKSRNRRGGSQKEDHMQQPSAAEVMRRCAAGGKMLDLTRGEPGAPECVDRCEAPSVRSVQSEGVAFCLLPVLRDAPLDISFTLALRGINWKDLPDVEVIRMHLPLAAGQALQVAPGDVMGELMVRDADLYEGFDVAAFELRRIGGEVGNVPQPTTKIVDAAKPATTTRRPAEAIRPTRSASAEEVVRPIDAALVEKEEAAPAKDDTEVGEASSSSKTDDLTTNKNASETGSATGITQSNKLDGRSKLRGSGAFRGFGPVGMPCLHCDAYVAMRCEAWRISSNNSEEEPNALLRALLGRNHDDVQHQLGLPAGWSVLHYSAVPQARGFVPIEVAGTEPAFRFAGYDWGADPVLANLTRIGPDGAFGMRGDGNMPELFGMEMILFFIMFLAVGFIVFLQALGVGLKELRTFDRATSNFCLESGRLERGNARRAIGGRQISASSGRKALAW